MHNFYFSNNINIRWFIIVGLVLHIIAAYFSIGFFNLDEHFQILSPLAKLLNIEYTATWEFDSKIRPWLQPYFYFLISKIISPFGFDNPFEISFFIRLISSLIGFSSILYLFHHTKKRFGLDNNLSKIIIFSFWFYAFLHARTSSENLSISMLIFGVIFFDNFLNQEKKNNKYKYSILSGIFLGLSMILKYQIVISVFFVFIWFVINKFNLSNFKYITLSILTILFILILGLIIDYYGYESFNNTYYQYYYSNFVDKWFESFGNDPWWFYIKLVLEKFFPPISLLIIFSLIFFCIKEFKSIFAYITLPVLIALSLLSNKEIRFIFPVLIFTPFFISYFFSNTRMFFAKLFLINLVIIFNIFFFALLFIPANEQVKIYEYLYYNNNDDDNIKIFYDTNNPYIIDDLKPKFYTSFLPKIKKLDKTSNLDNSFVIIRNYNKLQQFKNKINCDLVFSIYPEIINKNKNWREREFNWYIFKC